MVDYLVGNTEVLIGHQAWSARAGSPVAGVMNPYVIAPWGERKHWLKKLDRSLTPTEGVILNTLPTENSILFRILSTTREKGKAA